MLEQKWFCDICKKEINLQGERADFVRVIKKYPLMPGVTVGSSTLHKEEFNICEHCLKPFNDVLEELLGEYPKKEEKVITGGEK